MFLRRRVLLLGLAVCFIACSLAAQSYSITPTVSSLPAGSYGATLIAAVKNVPAGSSFAICFYTGHGSNAPIAPSSSTGSGASTLVEFSVPASTIQAVPPSAFTAGSFKALLYTVSDTATSCTGSAQADGITTAITLAYPTLSSISLNSAPLLNPKLTSIVPSNLSVSGTNFLRQSGTSGNAPSTVAFNSTNSLAGNVRFISSTKLVSTIPTSFPPNVYSVSVQVCNTAVYSYCSGTKKLALSSTVPSINTVTATPSSALPSAPITVSATFGPKTPSVAGAPGGVVAFHYAAVQLGSATLTLDPTGVFVAAAPTTVKAAGSLVSPLVADFNQDGIADLLLIESGSANLHLLLGTTPSGSFAADQLMTIPGTGLVILSAAVADLNNDGFPDIALLCQSGGAGNTIYTLLNDGSGSFLSPVNAFPVIYGARIVAGDFNKDGKQDLAVAGALGASGAATGLQVLLGDGSGSFTAGPATAGSPTAPSASFGGYQIATADFNNDGYPDIAVLNGANSDGSNLANSVNVFQNDGTGAFAKTVNVPTDGASTTKFMVAPLGPGQLPAILVTSTTTPGISVALNQSVKDIAFFGTPQLTAVPGFIQAVAGDFNGDGLLDITVDDGNTVHVLTGNGLGNFSVQYTQQFVPSGSGSRLLAASDENDDTYADLLVLANEGNSSYAIRDYITAGTASATLPAATYPVGVHSIQARTPGTFDIECGSVNTTLIIAQATPVLTWPTPPTAVAGTQLGPQLDATATGLGGGVLPGTFVYSPALGTVLTAGTQTLSLTFYPSDNVDYLPATATVSLNVVPFSLSGVSTTTALLGDAAKTITLTGSGFLPSAVVQVNGTPIPTTFVSITSLTAVVPAADFLTVQTLQVTVFDTPLNVTSAPVGITVAAPTAAVSFSGPSTIAPGTQTTLNFALGSPYPVDLHATFTITFTPANGLPDDPNVQFSSGGRTLNVTIPEGSTNLEPVEIQSGTVAGTIVVATTLQAGGANVTPASLQPLSIEAAFAVPGIVSVKFTTSGNMLTVITRAFSNTREISGGEFHFTPAAGASLKTENVILDVTSLYGAWYSSSVSAQYGSECTYTQVFNLSSDASVVGKVSVILTNQQGASPEATTP